MTITNTGEVVTSYKITTNEETIATKHSPRYNFSRQIIKRKFSGEKRTIKFSAYNSFFETFI